MLMSRALYIGSEKVTSWRANPKVLLLLYKFLRSAALSYGIGTCLLVSN
jgi:hypothetical protein